MSNGRDSVNTIGGGLWGWFMGHWKERLPENFRWQLEDTFQPEDIAERLLPYEEPQLEIRLAWYRDILGILVFHNFRLLLGVTVIVALILLFVSFTLAFSFLWALLPFALLIMLVVAAFRKRVEYLQWRLLKTNARLIISIPQHGSFPLVDNIELKGVPTVVDTNWSKSPMWRVFQFFTGARDLYLSLAAYRFVEGTARVGDALVIPDVMPRDIFELKKLVFAVPRPPGS
jgi:hypothetical protein